IVNATLQQAINDAQDQLNSAITALSNASLSLASISRTVGLKDQSRLTILSKSNANSINAANEKIGGMSKLAATGTVGAASKRLGTAFDGSIKGGTVGNPAPTSVPPSPPPTGPGNQIGGDTVSNLKEEKPTSKSSSSKLPEDLAKTPSDLPERP